MNNGEIVPGFDAAQSRHDRQEPPDYQERDYADELAMKDAIYSQWLKDNEARELINFIEAKESEGEVIPLVKVLTEKQIKEFEEWCRESFRMEEE